ncbi:MAG: hypothetical protein GX221_07320 [Candidatus Riflebacteria bacterium]|nr:hypothetical protein [Candidatus Riflebacteria bacterium]
MKKQEIEFKVLDIIERVEKSQPIEDDTIELKAEWPKDHFRAARRIAAHANSARGEQILWIIGIDEKNGVVGADFEELSIWYAKIKSCFDQLMAPNLISLAIPYDGKTVVALLFETDRSPFVIKLPASMGPATCEVPWREANSTRSARRGDLIKLLHPAQKLPEVEIIDGKIELQKAILGSRSGKYQWTLSVQLYFMNYSQDVLVIPFHKCEVAFRTAGFPEMTKFSDVRITPPLSYSSREFKQTSLSLTVQSTEHEALINTAGMAILTAELYTDEEPYHYSPVLETALKLQTHTSETPILLDASFSLADSPIENVSSRILAEWALSGSTDE